MKINKSELDATQLGYLKQAEQLQSELIAHGFMASRIEKQEDDRCTFNVIFFDGTRDYIIKRDYRGYITVFRLDYENYSNVDHYQRHEIYKKYTGVLGNMKVMNAKKLQARIDAENAYHEEMTALNNANMDKKSAFLARIQQLELEGYDVRYQRDYEKDISGGTVTRNGIELHFEISQGGYVQRLLTVNTRWKEEGQDDIADFIALSDNQYRI